MKGLWWQRKLRLKHVKSIKLLKQRRITKRLKNAWQKNNSKSQIWNKKWHNLTFSAGKFKTRKRNWSNQSTRAKISWSTHNIKSTLLKRTKTAFSPRYKVTYMVRGFMVGIIITRVGRLCLQIERQIEKSEIKRINLEYLKKFMF